MEHNNYKYYHVIYSEICTILHSDVGKTAYILDCIIITDVKEEHTNQPANKQVTPCPYCLILTSWSKRENSFPFSIH